MVRFMFLHMAMVMTKAGNQKNDSAVKRERELKQKLPKVRLLSGFCCFGWAMYAPWASFVYAREGTLQPQTANMAAYCPL